MSLKIGFSKEGLTLNGKKFHPLNMPLKSVSLESDVPVEVPKAEDILSVFSTPNIRNVSREQGVEVLRQMLEKMS